MKFKVTRKEPLEKAMNKANLVLVEVPVNTKKGQHRSHRWKRAIDALDQLFEDLGKKANSEDIAFIDKDTNKKVNKEELIKDYKKRAKKENKTLQTFVAENYKVSTKEDGKEDTPTINNQNIKSINKEETKEDRDTVPQQEVVTMYSKNKYERETFTGTFSCGHEDSVEVGGYSEEYRKQAALGKFDGLCPHCQQKKIEEEREREREEARKVAGELNLPELQGSEKQIKWALSIRNRAVEELKPSMDYAEKLLKENPSNNLAKAYVSMAKDLINNPKSSTWIDYRQHDFKDMIARLLSGYKWNSEEDSERFNSSGWSWSVKKTFLYDYDSLPKFDNEKANHNRDILCYSINSGMKRYLNNILKENANNTTSNNLMDIMDKLKDIVENTNDELYYESLDDDDLYIVDKTNQYRGKLLGGNNHEANLKAYKRRNELIREFLKKKQERSLSDKQEKIIDAFFQSATEASIYNKTYVDSTIEEIAKDIENEIEKSNIETRPKKVKHNWNARLRYGTKKIESKKEYPVVKSFEEFNTNLMKLKDLHTDTLGRAALDMAGIDVPLYVKRNGNLLVSGGDKCYGYCSRSPFGSTIEVAIVDDPSDRIQSYKTTVHETMHAVLGNTLENYKPVIFGLRKRFEEGIVELVAGSSIKEAYGKDYMNKNRRSYTPFVVDTLLRLKKTKRFKGQTLSQIGREIGRLAFEGDGKAINSIKSSLERSLKSGKTIYDVAKGYDDINKLEEATKRNYAAENNGDMTNFEKTELAMLIDRIKNTDFTLKDALQTKGDIGFLATVLLYNMLDEEDDELLGLL